MIIGIKSNDHMLIIWWSSDDNLIIWHMLSADLGESPDNHLLTSCWLSDDKQTKFTNKHNKLIADDKSMPDIIFAVDYDIIIRWSSEDHLFFIWLSCVEYLLIFRAWPEV